MQSYIGAKIIKAEPMTDMDFERERALYNEAKHLTRMYQIGESLINAQGCAMSGHNERDAKAGYKVMYPDGYMSWSPKHVFEEAYRLISQGEKGLI